VFADLETSFGEVLVCDKEMRGGNQFGGGAGPIERPSRSSSVLEIWLIMTYPFDIG
jgi:hypothetical protein